MLLGQLEKRGLIKPPDFLISNTHYLTIMGSYSYGVNMDTSDMDVYGWCIPKKETIFPHLAGKIMGFDNNLGKFDQWKQDHVLDKDAQAGKGKMYDLAIYSIIKYFRLLTDNNPNIVDSIFTAEDCVLHCTQVGRMVRDERKIFLHKGSWHKFRGYAWSQWNKIKKEKPEGSRKELIEKYGYDIKFGYHLIRLLNEVEQILINQDLDLRLNNDCLIAIRSGNVPLNELEKMFFDKQKSLENLYIESKIPYGPDEEKIKALLLKVLEHHFGSLQECVRIIGKEEKLLKQIKELVKDY